MFRGHPNRERFLEIVSVCLEKLLFVSVVLIPVRNTETNQNFFFDFAKQTEKQPKQIEFRFVLVRTEKKVIVSRTPYSPASPGRSGVIVFSILGSNHKQMLFLSGCSAFYGSELFYNKKNTKLFFCIFFFFQLAFTVYCNPLSKAV
jgi:hypothetical protein